MTDVRVYLAFAALAVLALCYIEFAGVKPSLAPLCAVGTVALWFSLFGCLGLLRAAGWVMWALVLVGLGALLWRWVVRKRPLPALSFGFGFFLAAGLVLILLLQRLQPMFTAWDEFSFWGTAGKLTKLYDELYTTAPVGWPWPASNKPALVVLAYFFQFFGADFVEWQTYAACNVFLVAMMAAVLAPLDGGEKTNWNAAVPASLLCLLAPYVFLHYGTAAKMSAAYLDSLGDIPMGFCFAGVLCAGVAARQNGKAGMVPVCLGLATLTMVKDMGFALALVAAVLVGADAFLANGHGAGLAKRLKGALAKLGVGLASVLVCFVGWEVYQNLLTGASRTQSAGGKTGLAIQEYPLAFLKDLTASPRSEFFEYITGSMARFFFTARGNMLGSGFVIFLIVCALLLVAAFVYKNRAYRLRCLWFGVLSTAGFALYYWLITMTYLYTFREAQARDFESVDRYVFPYYIGWLLAAVCFVCAAIAGAKNGKENEDKKALLPQGVKTAGAKLVLAGLAGFVFLKVALMVPMNYTILGAHSDEYNQRREFSEYVQGIRAQLDPGGKTFLVMSGDSGIGWFQYCHEMLPWQMDYSFGGGKMERQEPGTGEKTHVGPEELARHLMETGCTTVFIDYADPDFVEEYGALFSDKLNEYTHARANLYAVERDGDGVILRPVLLEAAGG